MIGQFGKFDINKQERDFRPNFIGVEATSFGSEEDTKRLLQESEKHGFSISVHFPLRSNKWRLRDAQFLSKDRLTQKESYAYARDELEYIKKVNPNYVLFHYPKPVILDKNVDWSNWRFADETEYYYETEYSLETLKVESNRFFAWLETRVAESNITPIIELDALNMYLHKTNLLEVLLTKYSKVKLCLDIGRIHLQNQLDGSFDAYSFVRKYAKYAEVIHLWNVKVGTNIESSHYPTLPWLDAKDGWADIALYLSIIKQENKYCKVLFEHRSDWITDEELNRCYDWVEELLQD